MHVAESSKIDADFVIFYSICCRAFVNFISKERFFLALHEKRLLYVLEILI